MHSPLTGAVFHSEAVSGPPTRPAMSASTKAVFLSYASQDVVAALRICAALRAAGVEVWFDQDALVGGDAWDGKIRGQIGSCVLFTPVISAHTQARPEGYFRLEWKLAAQRTHMISERTAFLLPVVIDATRDAEALNHIAPPAPKKSFTAEEKKACSIEAMKNGEECEACQ